jgi:hypothetical protein
VIGAGRSRPVTSVRGRTAVRSGGRSSSRALMVITVITTVAEAAYLAKKRDADDASS